MAEIWDSPAGTDFAVTSGILTFQEGQDRNSLQISTSQDEDPEGNELYQVLLISGAGGARVESDARTLLSGKRELCKMARKLSVDSIACLFVLQSAGTRVEPIQGR